MKLIVLTSPDFFVEEDQILTSLFEEGLDMLYLRKPGHEPVYSERLLTLMSDECRRRTVVYDHFYLKDEFQLQGIHLSRHCPTPPADYTGFRSRSAYSLADITEARRTADLVLLSHVFDSLSDAGQKANFTPEELQRAPIDRHTIAMGGVTLDNIPRLRDLGFGGVALRGDLWTRFNIHRGPDFRALINHFRQLRRATE